MLKLRRLKIDRFRNVAPGTELHFDDGVNVLLGKNGTGKTTLLALISAICRSDFSDYAEESLDIQASMLALVGGESEPVELEFGLRLRLAGATTDPRLPASRAGWEFSIRVHDMLVTGTEHGSHLETPDVKAFGAALSPFVPRLLDRALDTLTNGSPNWSGDGWRECYRLDESLEAFLAMTSGGSDLHLPRSAGGCPPADVVIIPPNRRPLRNGGEFFPADLLGAIFKSGQASIAHFDDDLRLDAPAYWAELLGFDRLEWRAELLDRLVDERGEPRRRFGKFAFRGFSRDGVPTSHTRFSYGQRRMLSVLYYMGANPDAVIADELVNGLHHDWIEALISRLGQRQAFLTSQNPLLFDFLKIESAEQAERMFVLCEASEDERGSVALKWRNMSASEAKAFYEELAVGIDYASEVLQRKGLW